VTIGSASPAGEVAHGWFGIDLALAGNAPWVTEVPEDWDAIVVGGGPAGLAAATWLGRYRRRTLLVDAGEGRNRWVEHTHGYLGQDPLIPQNLRATAHEQLRQYPLVRRVADRVISVRTGNHEHFEVDLEHGGLATSRRVVLATGVRDEFPGVDRFFEFYGADVFHCSACDGFDARNRSVVVIGWGEHVAGFAIGLLDWAANVVIVTDGRRSTLTDDEENGRGLHQVGIEVIDDQAVAFVGERGNLEGVRLAGGATVPCSQVFFSIAHHPVTALAEALGCAIDDDGYVMVDSEGETTVGGVYAAGDLTPGMQLVAVAAGKGTVAGVSCARSLHGEGAVRGAPEPAPDPDEF
jgi:thioredoxin reductase